MGILSTNFGGADVTKKSQDEWSIDNSIVVRSDEPAFFKPADPWPNVVKTTSMLYDTGEGPRVFVCAEHPGKYLIQPGPIKPPQDAEIREVRRGQPPRPDGAVITILAMTWGPHVLDSTKHYAYAYACHLTGNKVKFTNDWFGRGTDTWKDHQKTGVIFYTVDGDDKTIKQLARREGQEGEF